ncbi:MAG: ribonuclease HII [Chloroflexi bacterium]|nr:ribonuclease HII [Chloroflexota bacterium]
MNKKVSLPDFTIEKKLLNKNYKNIAGIDEVGRGTLAGPVVACAAILPNAVPSIKKNLVNDSKKLTVKKRIESYEWLKTWCLDYAIGSSSPKEIDTYGIIYSVKQAMIRAVNNLSIKPDYLIIDALKLENLDIDQTSIIKADEKSETVASASILAKVSRDNLMIKLHEEYSAYDFISNKGYGTKKHLIALKEYGPTEIHRKTFARVSD